MASAPSITGVLETSLYVADIDASVAFYGRVFGFPVIFSEANRLKALNVCGRQVLLLFQIGATEQAMDTPNGRIPPHGGSGALHLAFSIAPDDLQPWRDHLREMNISIESEVHCGGHSVYFRDPDGHLLELITPGCWPL